MTSNRLRIFQLLTLALLLTLAPAALAQDGTNSSAQGTTSAAPAGQKMKIKGVVTRRDSDTFTVQDVSGANTIVRLADRTSVKTKGGFLGGGTNYATTNIVRGLNLEVEGRTDASGQLVAEKVRFNDSDLRVAQSLRARVDPVESRVGSAETKLGEVEQNAQRMSGQLDELSAVSNAARGGAAAAQQTADAALVGVNSTNERVSALDDYQAQQSVAVNFKYRSAVLSRDAKAQLDEIAKVAFNAKGYLLEVSGFTAAEGNADASRRLSQSRADAVIRYLVEQHRIPLRRITTPYGYGAAQPVAENTTRAGREQNRRVEIRMLVNRGLTQPAPDMNPTKVTSATP